MPHRRSTLRMLGLLLVVAGALSGFLAEGALASSGSITGVHAVDGKVSAAYTTTFDVCTASYCGWFAHAYQYPASEPCTPDGTHLTYVGDVHSTSGSESETDTFYPAYVGSIRICLYVYHSGHDYFIAEAVFVPSMSMSGSITNVHSIGSRRVAATYTTQFSVCTLGSCSWYPHAWQLPAAQPCRVDTAHLTYVGDVHSSPGRETGSDYFYPIADAVRVCLYVSHHQQEYLIAEAVYYATPAPTGATTTVVGDQELSFLGPRGCVPTGRSVRLAVLSRTKRNLAGRRPRTSVSQVEFSFDLLKRLDRRAPWEAVYSTVGFLPRSTHRVSAKISLRQRPSGRRVIRTLGRSFRIC